MPDGLGVESLKARAKVVGDTINRGAKGLWSFLTETNPFAVAVNETAKDAGEVGQAYVDWTAQNRDAALGALERRSPTARRVAEGAEQMLQTGAEFTGGGPAGLVGMTRIAPGASKAVQTTLRENLVQSGLNKARQVFSPSAATATEVAAAKHPRTFAHAQVVEHAPTPGATMSVDPFTEAIGPKVAQLRASPSKVASPTAGIHELTHVARANRMGPGEFADQYQTLLDRHGYWQHPDEILARTNERFHPAWDAIRLEAEQTGQRILPGMRGVLREDARAAERMRAPQMASMERLRARQQLRDRQLPTAAEWDMLTAPAPRQVDLPFASSHARTGGVMGMTPEEVQRIEATGKQLDAEIEAYLQSLSRRR